MTSWRPRAVFMAFGTKGDVYPVAAVACALSRARCDYQVFLITHSAHKSLGDHLEERGVAFVPVSTPPVLSRNHNNSSEDARDLSFSMQTSVIKQSHRKECLTAVGQILGDGSTVEGDVIVINFFALEGWNLAEMFHINCIVAAPYVVPYSAPHSFEHQFKRELPILYNRLQEASLDEVSWRDVVHWMWPLFTEDWGSWRSKSLNLSPIPFTDPVTYLPSSPSLERSPLLLYGFSGEIVECPGYWPKNVHACGFWFLPHDLQFSCIQCRERKLRHSKYLDGELCSDHSSLEQFLKMSDPSSMPVFIGLSSIGSMGYLKNPRAFLLVVKTVIEKIGRKFVLFTSGYEPLNSAIGLMASESCQLLFENHLFCFSGDVPYSWLFDKCSVAIHHGGSGSTAAAVASGIPQVVCPFVLDQFYWAERMYWLGLAPEPLNSESLAPENDDATTVEKCGRVVSRAVELALSSDTRSRVTEVAHRVSLEDGISSALKILELQVLRSRERHAKRS